MSTSDNSVTMESQEAGNMADDTDQSHQQHDLVATALEQSDLPDQAERVLSTFEHVFTTHAPILESLLLQIPTLTVLQLYHTSRYLRSFLRSYPTAWKYLSFRLLFPSGPPPPSRIALSGVPDGLRQSQPYAQDQMLMNVVVPFSPCLRSLELDNTAVSGQILISTVLHSRRETLEHLSVRGCKNVSLKYHIVPYLKMFELQCDAGVDINSGNSSKQLALKSLYTYRCRHHRRRPYLATSLVRKDSDSEPTHDLVNLCHKLGIWTDTAWCSTPAGRCFRRRGYVSMRVPQGTPEVWVVFDRLWRSKNWIGPIHQGERPASQDVRLWEHNETGFYGEALGTGEGPELGDGKMLPTHLRRSHTRFVEDIRCDLCSELIPERCEQCSILMHCVGCRKTLCASCAYQRPYSQNRQKSGTDNFWWAPGASVSPCVMQDPSDTTDANAFHPGTQASYPALRFHWCCTEPIFSGGGGISIGTLTRDVDQVRAVPMPRGQGWEDIEYTANDWTRSFPRYAYGDPKNPDYTLEAGHIAMIRWLLGPPHHQVSTCPRNLCQECYDSPQWKVHCKTCSKSLCIEHDLRGLRLRICGYRDLAVEKLTIQDPSTSTQSRPGPFMRSQIAQTGFAPGFGLPPRHRDSAVSSQSEDQLVEAPGDDSSSLHDAAEQSDVSGSALHSESFSTANSNHSCSSSPSPRCDTPADLPKWLGCQSFFCPQYRSMGDLRQRCSSVLRECTSCHVYVCQDCVKDNPPCHCSFCEANYLCPNCMRVRQRDGTCRRPQEEKAKRERKWKKDMAELESILEKKLANELVEYAGQFFNQVEGLGNPVDADDRTQGPSSLYSIPQMPAQSTEGAGDTPIDDDG